MRAWPLLAAIFVFAAALAATGCGDKKSAASDVPPQQRVETALKNAADIKSGVAELDASVAAGNLPGSLKITGGGPFDTEAEGGAAFELDLKVNIAGFDQSIGFIAYGGKSYVKIGEQVFESGKGESANGAIDPKSIQSLINSLNKYVSDVKQIAGKTVDGQSLDVYSMTVDLAALAKDAKEQSGGKSASIPGVGDIGDLAKSLGKAEATVGIGADEFPHEIGIDATFEAEGGSGGAGGGVKGTLVLTDINKPVTIEEPKNVESNSSALDALGGLLGGQ